MLAHYDLIQRFIWYGKIAGAAVSFISIVALLHTKLVSPVFSRVKTTNEAVAALMNNHLPHLQESLNNQDKVLGEMKTDVEETKSEVKSLQVGLDNTAKSVDTLQTAFMTHLENASKEKRNVKPRRSV